MISSHKKGSAASTGISVIALIISLIALAMTWYLYTQPIPGSDVNVEQEVAKQVEVLRQESQFALSISQARNQLGVIKAGIELIENRPESDSTSTPTLSAENFYPRATTELSQIQKNLNTAFNTINDSAVTWNSVERQLEQLRQELSSQDGRQAIEIIDALQSLLSSALASTS